ncbi:MAG: redoxin domain-containing protein [Cellulophaga sp.]
MIKYILIVFSFLTVSLNAQHTVSGTFSPAKKYPWLLVYKLDPYTLAFAQDTPIKNGKFSITFPKTSTKGTYRFVYGLPQDEFYFDVIYNGTENIEFSFEATKGVSFITSEDNKIYSSYFREINKQEQKILNFYSAKKTDRKEFKTLTEELNKIQTSFELQSKDCLSHSFIVANNPYIPANYESSNDYLLHKKEAFFRKLDFTNTTLQHSRFLSDKIFNYLQLSSNLEQNSISKAEKSGRLKQVSTQLKGTKDAFKTQIFYTLWQQLTNIKDNSAADYIYDSYLKNLALKLKKETIIKTIEIHQKLRFGAIAPEITWNKGADEKKLSNLKGADHYVVVFWSSGCPHCLKELPSLQKGIKGISKVTTLAIGLEDNAINWTKESGKLPDFKHALALGKWDSKYVGMYAITQTPSYFILDKNKKIVAKPEDYKGVVSFLNKK